MIRFLDKFLSNLPAVQTKQLLKTLSQMRDKGEIRTTKEFENKLEELGKIIQADEIVQQTPPLLFIEGELLESDAFVTFIEKLRLDMESTLGETENLGSTIRAHERILATNYFDSIESAIKELETRIRAFEVLTVRRYDGFADARIYSFGGGISVPGASDSGTTSLSDTVGSSGRVSEGRGSHWYGQGLGTTGSLSSLSSLFSDHRKGETLFFSPPGRGDPGLRLAIARNEVETVYRFENIEILNDSTTPSTALDTSTPDNIPTNAIDGSSYTAWRHSVLLPAAEGYPSVCRLKLKVSFSGSRRVNALKIEPLSAVPMLLYSVAYLNSTNQEILLDNIGSSTIGTSTEGLLGTTTTHSTDWLAGNIPKVIDIGDVTAKGFIITFQQDTAMRAQFFWSGDLGKWDNPEYIEDVIDSGISAQNTNGLPGYYEPLGDRSVSGTMRRTISDGGSEDSYSSTVGGEVTIVPPGIFGTYHAGTVRGGIIGADPDAAALEQASRSRFALVYEDGELIVPISPPLYENLEGQRIRGNFIEYQFGLKEISAISREYASNGVFVPEPFYCNPPSILAIHAAVDYPSEGDTDIEFLLRKENYSSDGTNIDVETIPVPRYGDEIITERLFLTNYTGINTSGDGGSLRFYPDFSQTFNVYEDGTLLTIGSQYEISVDNGETWETTTTVVGIPGLPQECFVRILSPRTEAIYTIWYIPLVSSHLAGGEVFLNREKTAWLDRYQTVMFKKERSGGVIDRCRMVLQIITRGNTLDTRVTPYTKEVVILSDL